LLGALDVFGDAGKAEAALRPDDVVLALEDLRVDEDAEIARLALFGDVDHEQLERHADLRRRETHARRRVHRLGHVVHELPDLVVHVGNLLALLAQALVRIVEDGADRHSSFSLMPPAGPGYPSRSG